MNSSPDNPQTDTVTYDHTQFIHARNRQVKEVQWLWRPFIPLGSITMLQGDGGGGKSTLAMKIAAMVSSGIVPPEIQHGRFQPATHTDPAHVFYATTENDFDTSALPRFLRNGGNRDYFTASDEELFHFSIERNELKYVIKELNARLVIIDPLQAFLPRGVAMGNQTAVREVFNEENAVAAETNTAILFIGHITKNERAKDIYRGFGSADIFAIMRSVLHFEEQSDKEPDAARIVTQIKSNFDESYRRPFYVYQDPEDKSVQFFTSESELDRIDEDDTDQGMTKAQEAEAFLKEMLSAGRIEAATINEQAKERKIGRSTLYRAKKELGIETDDGFWTMG